MKMSTAHAILKAVVKDQIENGHGKDQLTPVLRGDPGLGKTSLSRQVAKELGLTETTVILAQYDPADFGGLPFPKDDTAYKLRPAWMPREENVLVTIDELGQSMLMQQNLAAQLIEERRLGYHALPNRHAVVACTNKLSNQAGVQPMPSHLKDRVFFLDVEADANEWLLWAAGAGIHEHIQAFIAYRPTWLHKFDPKHDACPSPRSWAKASRLLRTGLDQSHTDLVLQTIVGEGAASDLVGFLRIMTKLPRLEGIWADPTGHPIPNDKMVAYGLAAGLAGRATTKTIAATMKYLDRWDEQEFVAFAVRALQARDRSLVSDPSVRDWAARKGAPLMA